MKKIKILSVLTVGAVLLSTTSCMKMLFPGIPIAPSRMKVITSVRTAQQANSIAIKDNLLFVAERTAGFAIYDISNPSKPRLLSTTKAGGLSIDELMVYGNVLYAGTGAEPYKFLTYNITDPYHPSKLASLSLMGPALSIDAWGADCYISERGIFAVELIDISDPSKPRIVTEVEGGSNDLSVYQNYIFTVGDSFCIWQKTGREKINLVSCIDLGGVSGNGIKIGYDCAYIATTGGLIVIDITDFKHPREVFKMKFNNPAYGIDIKDTYLYVASYQEGLKVFSLKNPKNPKFMGMIKVPGLAFDVKVKDSFVFVASDSGVTVVQVGK